MAKSYYPVYLDLEGRKAVVIGGGPVAERKVEKLVEAGAKVLLVSPQVTAELEGLARREVIRWESREYREGDLEGAFLAIAATDSTRVNRAVHREAEARHTLLNVVDVPHLCSFIAPSIIQRGAVTLAISTAGTSPALARKLREELPAVPQLAYADLAEVLSSVRLELKKRRVTVDPERWQACLNNELLETYRSRGPEEARLLLLEGLLAESAPLRGAE